MVRNSSMLSRSDRMDVIREAMNWGERSVSGNLEKALFLRAVGKGRDREFFGDVWLKLLYADDPRQFTGRCGRVICTQEYIDHIEQHMLKIVYPICCGMDVHRSFVVACIATTNHQGVTT